jgi:hypothetical protein
MQCGSFLRSFKLLLSLSVCLYNIFPHYLMKGKILFFFGGGGGGGERNEHKTCVLIFCTILSIYFSFDEEFVQIILEMYFM